MREKRKKCTILQMKIWKIGFHKPEVSNQNQVSQLIYLQMNEIKKKKK